MWRGRTIEVISELVSEKGRAVRGVDVASALGLSKSAAHRRLRILREEGLVDFVDRKIATISLPESTAIIYDNGVPYPAKIVVKYD